MKEQAKQVILAQIEKSIADYKLKIADLVSAREEFISSNSTGEKKKGGHKRLPAGAPKRMAFQAIQQHRRLFVSDWVDKIEEHFGTRLNDSTIRRGIAELEKEGLVHKIADGSFAITEKTETSDNSDDLPF